MPIGLIGMLPVLAVAVWLTLRQMKREEKNWTKGAVVHPSARRPLYYYINKKKPGKPARKTRKFGAKNWLLYTNAKKAQKTLKKGLPNPLKYGTICERQALRQKNDFWNLSTKPLKRTNRRSKTPADTEMLRTLQVQNVQKPRKNKAWQKTASVVK